MIWGLAIVMRMTVIVAMDKMSHCLWCHVTENAIIMIWVSIFFPSFFFVSLFFYSASHLLPFTDSILFYLGFWMIVLLLNLEFHQLSLNRRAVNVIQKHVLKSFKYDSWIYRESISHAINLLNGEKERKIDWSSRVGRLIRSNKRLKCMRIERFFGENDEPFSFRVLDTPSQWHFGPLHIIPSSGWGR